MISKLISRMEKIPYSGGNRITKFFKLNTFFEKMTPKQLVNCRLAGSFLIAVGGVGVFIFLYPTFGENKLKQGELAHRLTNTKLIDGNKEFKEFFKKTEVKNIGSSGFYDLTTIPYKNRYEGRSMKFTGYFDHGKEIHVPASKGITNGYDVYTPFYYYKVKLVDTNHKNVLPDGTVTDRVEIRPAGIAVNRGWIPANKLDRRTRPYDTTNSEITICGTLKFTGDNIHDYRVANNPGLNLWENVCPEDFAEYWELPNKKDASAVYLQELELPGICPDNSFDTYPQKCDVNTYLLQVNKEKK